MRFIQRYLADRLNGEGLRNVYFYSSCSHHCSGCFSLETWDPPQTRSFFKVLYFSYDLGKLVNLPEQGNLESYNILNKIQ